MDKEFELLADHEIRIRLLEENVREIKELRRDIVSQFHWTLGTIIIFIFMNTTIFGGIMLHLAKLI